MESYYCGKGTILALLWFVIILKGAKCGNSSFELMQIGKSRGIFLILGVPCTYSTRKKEREQRSTTMAMRRKRQKNTVRSHTSICNLPNPITSDILSRLPIKTVAHSMCVCRTWRDLVLDPHFAKLHLSRSSKSVSLLFPYPTDFSSGRGYIYMVDEQIKSGRFYYQKSIQGKFETHNFPLQILDVVCSCNGLLLCLCRMEDTVYICNPIKSSGWIVLPPPNTQSLPADSKYANYGFGFCHLRNQYKVIRIITTGVSKPSDRNRAVRFEILVIGDDRWRCIENPPFNQHCPALAVGQTTAAPWVPLNGSLHLVVKTQVNQYRLFYICCFKISEEVLQMVAPLPPCYSNFATFSLGVLHDCLMVLEVSDHYSQMNIWVMTDYGVRESWTRMFVLEGDTFKGFRPPSWLKPMRFTKDGELLMSYACQTVGTRSCFASYDPKSGRLRKHKLNNNDYRARIEYVPSFICPSDFVRQHNNNRVSDEPSQSVQSSN